jgi:hypothetical protein
MFGISVSFNYELYRGKFNSWCAFSIINYYLSILYTIHLTGNSELHYSMGSSKHLCIILDHWMSLLCLESVYYSTMNFIEVSLIVGVPVPSSQLLTVNSTLLTGNSELHYSMCSHKHLCIILDESSMFGISVSFNYVMLLHYIGLFECISRCS